MSPEELAKKKAENIVAFDAKIEEGIVFIKKLVDEFWADKFADQDANHPLKAVLAAAFIMDISNKMAEELLRSGRV